VLDIAGFEKDSAAYYRANWLPTSPTFVKVVPSDWNSPVPVGGLVTVRAFTGAASAEAFVNGVSLGKQVVPAFQIATWKNVPFQPGNLTAVAYDVNGAVVGTSVVATTGAATALVVSIVSVGAPTYAADGQDVAIFTVQVVDAAGAVVTDARPQLTFSVTSGPGTIYALGNGDPSDLTPDKVGMPDLPYGGVWTRKAWMGYARAVVQSQAGKPGSVTLTVSAPGLTSGSASFTTQ